MKEKILITLFGLYFVVCLGGIGVAFYLWHHTNISPEQPLAFSHVRHAGELKLECVHCHQYADKGPRATVPAMSICAKCHEKMTSESEDVKRLQELFKENEPVHWIKVHSVPWHVVFTHKRHIKAGVDCATCHGQVEGMEQVRRVRSLEMGWCVGCHRKNDAPTDCLTCHK